METFPHWVFAAGFLLAAYAGAFGSLLRLRWQRMARTGAKHDAWLWYGIVATLCGAFASLMDDSAGLAHLRLAFVPPALCAVAVVLVYWRRGELVARLRIPRMAYGVEVPAGARVDPALLPEEEFPVHCRKCRYLLRGIPDGPCPECGLEFDRGRRLIEVYLWPGGGAGILQVGRAGNRLVVAGIVILCLTFFGPLAAVAAAAMWLSPSVGEALNFWMMEHFRLWFVVALLGEACLLAGGALFAWVGISNRRRCRRVFEAWRSGNSMAR